MIDGFPKMSSLNDLMSMFKVIYPSLIPNDQGNEMSMKEPVGYDFTGLPKIVTEFPIGVRYIEIEVITWYGRSTEKILADEIELECGTMDDQFTGVFNDPPRRFFGYAVTCVTPMCYKEYLQEKEDELQKKEHIVRARSHFRVSNETYEKLKEIVSPDKVNEHD